MSTIYILVSFPDSTTHVRKGSGNIGAESWFCKLSSHVIILRRLVLEHVQSRDGAQDQENSSMSTALSLIRVGSGNEINIYDLVLYCSVIYKHKSVTQLLLNF